MRRILVSCFLMAASIAVAQLSPAPVQRATGSRIRQEPAPPETLDSIVSRMEAAQQRNREHYRAYIMTRDYKLLAQDDSVPKSEVIAELTFVPPAEKTFTIDKAEGSGRGISVVRDVLKHEADAAKHCDVPFSIARKNYTFALLGEDEIDGQPVWVLQLTPLHEETTLVRGRAWVDKNTYLVHRVEGDLAKNPSWWLKRVHTTVSFGNAAGMWLPVATYAVADVKIFGPHVFDSRVTKVETADDVATSFSPVPPDVLAGGSISAGARIADRSNAMRAVRLPGRRFGRVPAIIGAGVVR